MSDSLSNQAGWIQWFCSLDDHQFLCEIDEEYIRDPFNLYGLKPKFANYTEALEMILSPDQPDEDDLENEQFLEVYQEATDVYGLIHARFITTPRGLQMMRDKYFQNKFGVCPRVLCERQSVLPVGMSEELRTSRVKIFCPRCQDVYIPKKKCPDVDGAYFGCSFPQVFLLAYQEIQLTKNESLYVPRIYGFKVYKKKGSNFQEDIKDNEKIQVTHYNEELLQKIKGKPKY